MRVLLAALALLSLSHTDATAAPPYPYAPRSTFQIALNAQFRSVTIVLKPQGYPLDGRKVQLDTFPQTPIGPTYITQLPGTTGDPTEVLVYDNGSRLLVAKFRVKTQGRYQLVQFGTRWELIQVFF
jgi:hypothetical protein